MKDNRRFVALILLWLGFIATLIGVVMAVYGILVVGSRVMEAGYYLALLGTLFTIFMIVYCFVTIIRHEFRKRLWPAKIIYVLSLLLTAIGIGNIALANTGIRHAMGYFFFGAVVIGIGLLLAFIITAVMMIMKRVD